MFTKIFIYSCASEFGSYPRDTEGSVREYTSDGMKLNFVNPPTWTKDSRCVRQELYPDCHFDTQNCTSIFFLQRTRITPTYISECWKLCYRSCLSVFFSVLLLQHRKCKKSAMTAFYLSSVKYLTLKHLSDSIYHLKTNKYIFSFNLNIAFIVWLPFTAMLLWYICII